jgi:Flp pilus assembly pilin Flp
MTIGDHTASEARRPLRRLQEEGGQTLVEYALIIAVVSLGSLIALGFLSGEIQGLFSKTGNSINNVGVAAPSGGGSGSGSGSGGGTAPPAYVSGASISCTPEVSGVCQDTGTMAVATGTWTGDPAPTFAYQWWYNPTGSAANTCTTANDGGGWVVQAGSGSSQPLPDIPSNSVLDAMKVIVTGSNTDPGSPVSVAFCRTFESAAPPPGPSSNQTITSGGTVSTSAGNATITAITGSFGGTWLTDANVSGSPSPDGIYRDFGGSNPSSGSSCGFTLSNGFSFSGTWHLNFNEWDTSGHSGEYDYACY